MKHKRRGDSKINRVDTPKKKKRHPSQRKFQEKKKRRKKRGKRETASCSTPKKHRSLSFKCLHMCLFDTNTSGFTEELTKAPSTTENRWKKRGKKKTVLLMSLNKRERTQTFKSRRKVPKPRTSDKKKKPQK